LPPQKIKKLVKSKKKYFWVTQNRVPKVWST
jgi:hypothetical protein